MTSIFHQQIELLRSAFDQNDEDTYIPLYFNSNQDNISDSTSYDFSAVNMKTETGSPLDTADFEITNFLHQVLDKR